MTEPSGEGTLQPFRRIGKLVRFGDFEFSPATQELHKSGIPIKIQPKPLLILCALTDHPGELVTREALCRRLWSDGSFVDFESGLNTAMNRLRVALGDSAERPSYIQTVSRVGYRFICLVEVVESAPGSAAAETAWQSAEESDSETGTERLDLGFISTVKSLASQPKSYLVLLVLAAVLVILLFVRAKGLAAQSQAQCPSPHSSQSTVQACKFLLKAGPC